MSRYMIVPRPRYSFWNLLLDAFLIVVTMGAWIVVIIIRQILKGIRGY